MKIKLRKIDNSTTIEMSKSYIHIIYLNFTICLYASIYAHLVIIFLKHFMSILHKSIHNQYLYMLVSVLHFYQLMDIQLSIFLMHMQIHLCNIKHFILIEKCNKLILYNSRYDIT